MMIVGLGQVFCKENNKKEKTTDLIAEATLYEPSYSQPEHGSAYKKYSDDYGKYDKAYGDNGYNHYGKPF